MPRPVLAAVLALLPTLARANPPVEEVSAAPDPTPPSASWHYQAGLSVPSFSISSGQAHASGSVTVIDYIQPLVDDGSHPLELLPFLEHPNSLALSPGLTYAHAATGILPTTFQPTTGLTVNWFPWRHTGFVFTGNAGTVLSPGESTQLATVSYGLGVGLQHYWRSNARFELSLQGARTQDTDLTPPRGNGSVSMTTGMTLLLLDDRLSTHLALTGGANPNGVLGTATASAEYFFNRRTSLAVSANGSRTPIRGPAGAEWASWSASLVPTMNLYVTDSLLLSLRYTASWSWFEPSPGTASSSVGWSAAWRF